MTTIEESIEVQPIDEEPESTTNDMNLMEITPPPPIPEPKAKPKAKAKPRARPPPKTEIAVEPVQSNTVNFSMEQREPPAKPVCMTKKRAEPKAQPTQVQPPTIHSQVSQLLPPSSQQHSAITITPEQIQMYLANQRMLKAQRKDAKARALVAHAF